MRRDVLEQILHLGDARARDAVAAGNHGLFGWTDDAAIWRQFGRQCAVGGLEFREAARVDEIDVGAVLDVATAAGDGGAHLRLGGGAGLEVEGHVVTVGVFADLGDDLGGPEVCGVSREIGRELRAENLAQLGAAIGEDVEHAVAIAQPPFAREWIEREAVEF